MSFDIFLPPPDYDPSTDIYHQPFIQRPIPTIDNWSKPAILATVILTVISIGIVIKWKI